MPGSNQPNVSDRNSRIKGRLTGPAQRHICTSFINYSQSDYNYLQLNCFEIVYSTDAVGDMVIMAE